MIVNCYSLYIYSHSDCESTLARLYLSAGGHQDLTSELIKGRVLPTSSSAHPHWTNLVPKIVDIVLTKLYPQYIVVLREHAKFITCTQTKGIWGCAPSHWKLYNLSDLRPLITLSSACNLAGGGGGGGGGLEVYNIFCYLTTINSWPMTSSCNVSKFLLSTCQYTYLQVCICVIWDFMFVSDEWISCF